MKGNKRNGKKLVCNVESQGMMHQVTVSGNKVTVDGNAPMKIKDLPKERENQDQQSQFLSVRWTAVFFTDLLLPETV